MPYNRVRTWVGVAVIAVTIPAVGTYYNAAKSSGLRGTPVIAADHAATTPGRTDSFGGGRISIHPAARDYDAEVNAALVRQNSSVDAMAFPGSDEDPAFDLDPLPEAAEEPAVVPTAPAPISPPEPTTDYTGEDSRELVANDVAPEDDGQIPQMSDRTVYALVVNNLPEDQRAEFVRAYTLMTPDQRAELLDEFRTKLQDPYRG